MTYTLSEDEMQGVMTLLQRQYDRPGIPEGEVEQVKALLIALGERYPLFLMDAEATRH